MLFRSISYLAIALIIYFGADQFKFSGFFQIYGQKIIGPVLILIGLFMLGFIKINFPGVHRLTARFENKAKWRYSDAMFLGMVFALAFCPYSGILYFGILIPMTVASATGLYLPVIFALATGIPVILFAWILAYAVSGIGNAYQKVKAFEIWFRRFIAGLFIAVGIYYVIKVLL